MTMENALNFHIQKVLYIIIILDSWYIGGEEILVSLMNKLKQGML